MEKRVCVNCGKQFVIEDGEIAFYNKNGLSLPKRCKNCRNSAKEVKKRKNGDLKIKATLFVFLTAILSLVAGFVFFKDGHYSQSFMCFGAGLSVFLLYFLIFVFKRKSVSLDELREISGEFKYSFSNAETFKEHYLKHKNETRCSSPREYLEKANNVIASKSSLFKTEKEDGDKIYFNKKTGEIVFVSGYNKIRTYYICDEDYFNRQ